MNQERQYHNGITSSDFLNNMETNRSRPLSNNDGIHTTYNKESAAFPIPSLYGQSRLKFELLQRNKSREFQNIFEMRKKLPVIQQGRNILKAIKDHQVVLVVGSAGCGKTTQIPQMLLDDYIFNDYGSHCRIVCVQNRKDSAIAAASRVAYERIEPLGKSIGYQVAKKNETNIGDSLLWTSQDQYSIESIWPRENCFVLYCTPGIFLRFIKNDPKLNSYTAVIFDDLEENYGEFSQIMNIMKKAFPYRQDLKIILLSTGVSSSFCNYFQTYRVVYIQESAYAATNKTSRISTANTNTEDNASADTIPISGGESNIAAGNTGVRQRSNAVLKETGRNLIYRRRYWMKRRKHFITTFRKLYSRNCRFVRIGRTRRLKTIPTIPFIREGLSDIPSDSNLEVAVIDRSDPDGKISLNHWLTLEENLLIKMISVDLSFEGIYFNGAHWSKGIKVVHCGNRKSFNFLKTIVAEIGEVWPGAQLEVVPLSMLSLRIFARMWIPRPIPSIKVILKLIERQNNGIDTKCWKFIDCTISENGFGKEYRFCIDGNSAKVIWECHGRIKFGLNFITIRIEEKN